MENIYLLSDDSYLNNRWEKFISKEVIILEDEDELFDIENSILVLNMQVCKNIDPRILKEFIAKNNKILLLDNVPNLMTAQKYLNLGIKAYGNTYMSPSYLNSALEALEKGFVWLIPDITTQLVNSMVALNEKNDEHINDTIFGALTLQEKKIANLLKEGYTNAKISTHLGISINTVKTHIKHIYEKLSVKDRISFSLLFRK